MRKNYRIMMMVLAAGLLISACGGNAGNANGVLTASGTISAKSVNIAPELGGKITSLLVKEGDTVAAGETLFTIDQEYLQSQLDQANAGLAAAEAGLETAKVQKESADLRLDMAMQNSRFQFADALTNEQRQQQPGAFDLPVWYFTRSETIATAKVIVDRAAQELVKKESELEEELADIVNRDFIALENELGELQNAYIVYDAALDVASQASENKELKDVAQDAFDLYESKLNEVQARYDKALNTDAAEKVLEARAAVGAAQMAYDAAVNHMLSFYIGDDALEVQAAKLGAELAEKNEAQAAAGVTQAQTAVKSIEIQMKKATISSPIPGKVLAQNVEVGELIGAGSVVMTVGSIDEVSLTVYIPEDQFGRVNLGQDVKVMVDSFPEMVYMGVVTYIADNAEFTPSNVQTVEGRKSTVFAVEITIENKSHDLKSGMPADVEFIF